MHKFFSQLSWPELYLLTNHDQCEDRELLQDVEKVLENGTAIIQYRDKTKDRSKRLRQAKALKQLTRKYGKILIINDDIDLALESNADGVHLGRQDGSLGKARQLLGADAIIGVSCYNEFERARQAAKDQADYIAFGRFFNSSTKPSAPVATTDLLQQARQELKLPIVAIGGITPDNAATLLAAGADMIAVIDAVFGQRDINAASQQFINMLTTGTNRK